MYQIYQIGPNENLEMVAKKLGITIDELRRINGIGENASIISGSYIIIPGMNNMNNMEIDNYSKYVVKKGDTMYGIAKNNNTDLNTLVSLNGLNKNDYIYPNQEIVIPNRKTYVTQENDTIKDIVDKLNIGIDQIKDLYIVSDQTIMY